MFETNFKYVFKIVDNFVDEAVADLQQRGKGVSCRQGCSHCCHLLVEVSWEEAQELVRWIDEQEQDHREQIIERIKDSAKERKRFFKRRKGTAKFAKPMKSAVEIPEKTFDQYFYGKSRPCPLLENGGCSAYEARPTSCRLHLVSSPADQCSREIEDESNYEVPAEVEEAKERAGKVIEQKQEDGRWGEMSVMLYAVLKEEGML